MTRSSRERIEGDLRTLAAFGADPAGGTTRLSYSPAHVEAASWLLGRFRRSGLRAFADEAGNLFGLLEGDGRAPFLSGSHLDTVRQGGAFDGAAGIVVALEALRLLSEEGRSGGRPFLVAAFAEEEGARFQRALTGSAHFARPLTEEQRRALVDGEGQSLEEAAGIFLRGLVPFLDGVSLPVARPAFALEVHVEQGPRLERSGLSLAVPTSIAATSMTEIVFGGEMNPAGTTPMELRRDPFRGLVEVASRLDGHVAAFPDAVGTIGRVLLDPNVGNVIARRAIFSVDLRCPDGDDLDRLIEAVLGDCREVASRLGLDLEIRPGHRESATTLDPSLRRRIFQALSERGWQAGEFPSGAGHDAIHLARICPTAMLFVPSRGGRSHCPQEWSDGDHLARAARIVADVARSCDRC